MGSRRTTKAAAALAAGAALAAALTLTLATTWPKADPNSKQPQTIPAAFEADQPSPPTHALGKGEANPGERPGPDVGVPVSGGVSVGVADAVR